MRLTDDAGIVWQVHFFHEHLDPPRSIGLLRPTSGPFQGRALVTDMTTATLHRAAAVAVDGSVMAGACLVASCRGAEGVPAIGEAYCSERDEFRRPVGRKIALADAMRRHPELRGQTEERAARRRALWQDYLAKTNVVPRVREDA